MRVTMLFISILIAVLPLSASVFAMENKRGGDIDLNVFSLHLGSTRVVYNEFSSGETLTVINDQDYPMLVQSEVLEEDQKSPASFVVTPPLFRLDGHQSSRLRIIRLGEDLPPDRESLRWICVKGIPPKAEDKWAESKDRNRNQSNKVALNVQLSMTSCVKLFFRPLRVKGHPDDVADKIEWLKIGNKLKGINPTPFYMNLAELMVGGKTVNERNYIAPFSSYEYPLPMGAIGKVQWRIVTDYGGKSKQFEKSFKR